MATHRDTREHEMLIRPRRRGRRRGGPNACRRRALSASLAVGVAALGLSTVAAAPGSPRAWAGRPMRTGECTRVWTIDRRLPRTDLTAVAVDARGVWAVGARRGKGIVLRLTHRRWSSTTIAGVQELSAVAAVGSETWVVGNSYLAGDVTRGTVARQADGRWRVTALKPAPRTTRGFFLSGVAVSDGDVWVVGSYDNTMGDKGPDDDGWLVARRQAGRWRTWRGGFSDSLAAVSAVAADDVWAVGRTGVNVAGDDEVTLHWDGSRWQQAVRTTAQDVVALEDVLMLSHEDAWAVGEPRTEDVPSPTPVVEHWNGRRWTRVALPRTLWPHAVRLDALAARDPDDVWAGGEVNGHPALLHWDGSTWRRAAPPPVAAPIADLAAGHDGTLWAVGRGFVAHSACKTA